MVLELMVPLAGYYGGSNRLLKKEPGWQNWEGHEFHSCR